MLKTFAAAFSPIIVLGRGNDDGSSYENAFEVELIPDVLILNTYNQLNGKTDEIQGDFYYEADSTAVSYYMYVEYGFCIKPSTVAPAAVNTITTKWDCMQVRTSVDPN